MNRNCSESGWRAAAWAAALVAITLNFLQPLVHASLMREGGPMGAPGTASLWAALCLSGSSRDDAAQNQEGGAGSLPASGKIHDCCLGLAQIPALAAPSTAFVVVPRLATVVVSIATVDALSPVGIRDGPSQPRAPPFLV